ncbi:MAG: hypothetical protein LBJ74_00480, partial [Heliobacteriaceae bacterium]|jgi:hypothetical protein|nr:hypothetical protein [Heliobacteriaceae bacterium]
MKKNYSNLPYEIFNFQEIHSKYKKLNMLKSALGLDEAQEINEDLIFSSISKHNYDEFYLLEYIINKTICAPREIKVQNSLLISLYEKPEEYKKQYEAIKEAYKNEYIFKKFASSMRKDLYLQDKSNCELLNYQIYEICFKYITDERILEPANVHLNLHFVQKWMSEQDKLQLEPFTDVEEEIVQYLANGYSVYELVEENLIRGEKDKGFLNTIIHEILPVKCHVETINQVMAIHCCRCHSPAKTLTNYCQ